jgi:Binding-protein-dependent transport system inner membrane component
LAVLLALLAVSAVAVAAASAERAAGTLNIYGFGPGDDVRENRATYAKDQLSGTTINRPAGDFNDQVLLTRLASGDIPDLVRMTRPTDGDSYFSMFRRIALPLAKPALIMTFIFEIQAKWFDLMTPLIYLRDQAAFTVPLGLKVLLDRFNAGGGGEGDYQVIMAGTLLLVLPMVILFAAFQKYFVRGIAVQGRRG